jgi:hypothetical protein
MLRATAIVLALSSAAPVSAQSVTFHTTGGYRSVRAILTAGENGGFVDLEPGMILSSRNPDEQDLTLGSGVEADLAPGEVREVELPTFCLHYHRNPPARGQTMSVVGRVDRDIMSVIFDARGRARGAHQSAIWALREGTPAQDEAAMILARLRLAVKLR